MAVAERELTQSRLEAEEDVTPQPYRWTREQFYLMGEQGIFEGTPVILMEGDIVAMPPMKPPHQTVVSLTAQALRSAFGEGFFVREQAPFNVGSLTDPEPDVAVINGQIRDFLTMHPAKAALIVEVSNTTLAYDRLDKASLYAKSGIAEYWIVNVKEAQLEVHRQPMPDDTQPFGFSYSVTSVHRGGEIVQPLASPHPVAVSALLP